LSIPLGLYLETIPYSSYAGQLFDID